MAIRITFDRARQLFIDRGYTLLEDCYTHSKAPMRYLCAKHPDKTRSITYNDLQGGRGCKDCGYERNSRKSRLSIDTVRAEFSSRGYTLMSDNYVGAHGLLEYTCQNHPDVIRKIRFYALRNGQGCSDCAWEHRHLPIEDVRERFLSAGYVLLDDEYKGHQEKLRYKCPHHPDKETSMTVARLRAGDRCHFCYFDNMSGDDNPNWKGGVSELNNVLRASIWKWKVETKERLKVCYVSGSVLNLHVHHVTPYHHIRDEALANTGLNLRKTIGEYSVEELHSLVGEFLKLHAKSPAVLLRKDIHEMFHKIHGFDISLSDLDEFKRMYKSGELEQRLGAA